MPGLGAALGLLATLIAAGAPAPLSERILFTGDVMLGRNVEREMTARHESPWTGVAGSLSSFRQIVGNFEGAVGRSEDCLPETPPELCFAVRASRLELLRRAGFTALGLENNHAHDLGPDSQAASARKLSEAGLTGLTFEGSPWFLQVGKLVVGLVAYNEVPAPHAPGRSLPDLALAQKIRLARELSNLAIVYVHWGNELQDWASSEQRDHARWLVSQGADLIIGHHPHVVQGPGCVDGRPVMYSLGNHVFDQKYPATKTGLTLECEAGDGFRCRFLRSQTAMGTSFISSLAEDKSFAAAWSSCPIRAHDPTTVADVNLRADLAAGAAMPSSSLKVGLSRARSLTKEGRPHLSFAAASLISLARFEPSGERPLLLALQNYYSGIDRETEPRPYVYRIGPHGLIAKWRGSALAWPLLDITTLKSAGSDYLCALHRGDSFLALNPATNARRTRVYRWNGFGFSAAGEKVLEDECLAHYRPYLTTL